MAVEEDRFVAGSAVERSERVSGRDLEPVDPKKLHCSYQGWMVGRRSLGFPLSPRLWKEKLVTSRQPGKESSDSLLFSIFLSLLRVQLLFLFILRSTEFFSACI